MRSKIGCTSPCQAPPPSYSSPYHSPYCTARHLAAKHGHAEVLQMLLAGGAAKASGVTKMPPPLSY